MAAIDARFASHSHDRLHSSVVTPAGCAQIGLLRAKCLHDGLPNVSMVEEGQEGIGGRDWRRMIRLMSASQEHAGLNMHPLLA